MKTLNDVYKSAYIMQNCSDGYEWTPQKPDTEMTSRAKTRNKRYWNEILDWLQIENVNEILKNKEGKYQFTYEGSRLLEEVLLLYHESKIKPEGTKTEKGQNKQIFVYQQTDAFIRQEYLKMLEEICVDNELVVKVIDCFKQLFLDAGKSEEDAEKLLRNVAIRSGYVERKAYLETFKLLKDYFVQIKKVIDNEEESTLTGTEKALWSNYATSKLENTLSEVTWVYNMMLHIRSQERQQEAGVVYYPEDPELNEKYLEYENTVIETCKTRSEITNLIDDYEKKFDVKLELEQIVPYIMVVNTVGESELCKDEAIIMIKRLMGFNRDGEAVYKKVSVRQKEEILEKIINEIEVVIGTNWNERFEDSALGDIARNEVLLDKAIERCEEFTKMIDALRKTK